jgi:antitoxin VapB
MPSHVKPLNIKDPEAYRLARSLADHTGETLTQVVVLALRERSERKLRTRRRQLLIEEMKEIAERVKSMPIRDRRSAEEIIGYNDIGAFE